MGLGACGVRPLQASCTFLDRRIIISCVSSFRDRSMHPEIFAVWSNFGLLLVGPPHSLTRVTGATEIDVSFFGSWLRDLLARADSWRLRSAAVAWGVDEFDPRQRTEQRLQDQIARMLETGRLSACFLPLFRDDSHPLYDAGPLRVHQLGAGPLQPAPAPPPPPSSSPPPPPPMLARSSPQVEKDFPNEPDQAQTLRQAAKDGTPFCEVCAKGGR
jgi:hypothetical protein